eukprot:scaffold23620_cov19-Tisochrysis_lutea.AAC.5
MKLNECWLLVANLGSHTLGHVEVRILCRCTWTSKWTQEVLAFGGQSGEPNLGSCKRKDPAKARTDKQMHNFKGLCKRRDPLQVQMSTHKSVHEQAHVGCDPRWDAERDTTPLNSGHLQPLLTARAQGAFLGFSGQLHIFPISLPKNWYGICTQNWPLFLTLRMNGAINDGVLENDGGQIDQSVAPSGSAQSPVACSLDHCKQTHKLILPFYEIINSAECKITRLAQGARQAPRSLGNTSRALQQACPGQDKGQEKCLGVRAVREEAGSLDGEQLNPLPWGHVVHEPKAGIWALYRQGGEGGSYNGSRDSWADHRPPCASAWYSPRRRDFPTR